MAAQTQINVNGTGTGRVFEGIGAVSAGASSRLLMDYPEPYRSQVLDYLFKPNYGASLQYLKIELGGDMDSTDGSESSHMHSATDSNYQRGYEWWLMQQALQRNPNIKFGILAWGAPGWIGGGSYFSQDMINYIVNFIKAAQSQYGITIDDVGIWNETDPTSNYNWIVNLKSALVSAGLSTLVVAPDETSTQIISDMASNSALQNAVDVIGLHYPNDPQPLVIPGNKRVWATETASTNWTSDWTGASQLAHIYNRYYLGGITRIEVWPLVTSYLDFLPYPGAGLMYANTPWSGNYNVLTPIWATAQTTQFAQPGWQYLDAACGQLGNGTYVTLKSGSDFSMIIETMGAGTSQTVTVNISGGLNSSALHVWTTDQNNQFVQQSEIFPTNGSFTLTLAPQTIYSITTTTGQTKGGVVPPPPSAFPYPYSDNFESEALYSPGKYFSQIGGSFEVVSCGGGRGGQCLRQAAPQEPILWHEAGATEPAAFIGSTGMTDYQVSADVFLEEPGTIKLIGRLSSQDITSGDVGAYQFYVSSNGGWTINFKDTTTLASGLVAFPVGVWHSVAFVLVGSHLQGIVDGVTVADLYSNTLSNGMAGVGVQGWTTAQFDNFRIDLPPGANPIVPQSQVSASATSTAAGYPAANAVDGFTGTYWQTNYTCVGGCQPTDPLPQSITFNLGGTYVLNDLRYLPRQDNTTGSITSYNIYTSTDGVNFSLATSGVWNGDLTAKTASLNSVQASYVRLQAVTAVGGIAGAAEVNFDLLPVSNQPAPTVTAISPSSTAAGGNTFTLTVTGSNFTSNSVVRWNGATRPTTFVNSNTLTASIASSDIANAGSGNVSVYTPAPGGGTSSPLTFTINTVVNNPAPILTGISPTSATAGASSFTLTVIGSNFANSSVVQWNGSARTTTFVNSTSLTASISAADILSSGTVNVTVYTPAPGGGTSSGQTFTINAAVTNPAPVLTGISPSSASAGSAAFTLTVTGSNFSSNSVVQWNGTARITTYVSSTSLTASIGATDIASSGTANVTVFTPTPGGGTSSAQSFTISPAQSGGSLTTFVTDSGLSSQTLRNNFTGFVGMRITVGSAPIYVAALGRVCVAGNSQSHIVKLVDAVANADVTGASVTLSMSGCSAGQFAWVNLPASVKLSAGGAYYLVSAEVSGGDQWYDVGVVTPTSDATINNAVYLYNGTWYPQASNNYAYVPPNMKYSLTSSTAVATPTFSPAPGTYTSAQSVTLSDSTSGASIYYTTDGTTPTTSSNLYNSPISISTTKTINAIAVASGLANSGVASATYTIQGAQAAAPTFSLPVGTYLGAINVTISAAAGATIYYTTDGSTPTHSSAMFSTPIKVSATTTINAIASASGFSDSSVASATYAIQLASPTLSPAGGSYSTVQSVIISGPSGATIYYTTDGSTPTHSSAVYGGAIPVNTTTTITAIASETGLVDSALAQATYTIQLPQTAAPTFSPAGGTFTSAQSVTLSDATAGASIYYTTDGTTPTSSSSKYSAAITVNSTTTIRAIALASGLAQSPVSSQVYTIQAPTAATPTFSISSGTYATKQTVALSDTTSGATIYYTLDGTIPTTSSLVYSAPLTISTSTTVAAVAVAPGLATSAIASATYVIQTGGSFVTKQLSLPNLRNDFTGFVGMKITVGGAPLYVSALGRICVAGNTNSHTVKLVDGLSGSDLTGASITVNMSGCAAGQFVYAKLPSSITLNAAGVYYLASQETAGGDQWYEFGSLATTADASITSSIYYYSGAWYPINGAGTSYVPPNFQYSLTPGIPAPTYSPAAGNYTSAQSISISGPAGATIYYTTDGSIPTHSSAVYASPINVSSNTTITSIASVPGSSDSVDSVAVYTIQLAAPSLSLASGTFVGTQSVSISGPAGSTIYYTTDGSTPTHASTVYGGPISINNTTTIKAIAGANGFSDSAVSSATYTIQLTPPSFSLAAGTYTGTQKVTISGPAGATIYYTTDGSTPTHSSAVYSGAISVAATMTINAIAGASGDLDSAVASAKYTIQLQAAAPTFSLPGGTYIGSQSITMSGPTGATIYYTTDGSTPTHSSAIYGGPITVALSLRVNAIASVSGFADSTVTSVSYIIQLPAPTISPAGGTYTTIQTVSISGAAGSTIYYTTDGSTPTHTSAVYSGALQVGATETISALASAAGLQDSAVASTKYTIQLPQTPAPTFSPAGGTFGSAQTVTISDPGATIYYTTDGSTPTTSSKVYSGPFVVGSSTTVNAIALASGNAVSAVATVSYTITAENLVLSYVTSARPLRSDFSGWVGMKIAIGANSLVVSAVGRLCIAGNAATHVVELANSNGTPVSGGSATVNMSGCSAGQFVSAPLSSPVTLAANSTYYLASQEMTGGDKWYDLGGVTTTGDASSIGSAYSSDGVTWSSLGGTNSSYVPPTFSYTLAPAGGNPPFVTGYASSNPSLRNNFSGWVGMKLTVGATPVTVSYVGRVCATGNSGVHSVKFVSASTGADVAGATASVNMAGCTVGQFVYASLPAAVALSSGGTYYLVSQETSGGDSWYDLGSIQTGTAASVTGATYLYNGMWYLTGGPNFSYVPPNFK